MLCTEPIVLFFSMYNAFAFSVLFAFFAAYPFTFEGVYGFSTSQSGLAFLGIGLGVVLAVVTAIVIDRTVYQKKHRLVLKSGKTMVPPEHRLYTAMIGSFGLPIGYVSLLIKLFIERLTGIRLFWFAWSARSDVHWISPILAGVPFAWGNLCVFVCCS